MNNALMTQDGKTLEEKIRERVQSGSEERHEISMEELEAENRRQNDLEINEFFELSGGLDELVEVYEEDINQAAEKHKDYVVKREELTRNEEDPFHVKNFEQHHKVFTKEKKEEWIENFKEAEKDVENGTDDYVKDSTPFEPKEQFKRSIEHSRGTGGTRYGGGYGGSSSGKDSTKSNSYYKNENEKEPANLNMEMPRITDEVMKNASQSVPGWRERPQDKYSWGRKPGWKKRIKRFFKKKKVHIMAKVGMIMALQLGMAMIGKRYEFEGMGQMAVFLGMMMGIFYLTRELAEDGFDARGMGII